MTREDAFATLPNPGPFLSICYLKKCKKTITPQLFQFIKMSSAKSFNLFLRVSISPLITTLSAIIHTVLPLTQNNKIYIIIGYLHASSKFIYFLQKIEKASPRTVFPLETIFAPIFLLKPCLHFFTHYPTQSTFFNEKWW